MEVGWGEATDYIISQTSQNFVYYGCCIQRNPIQQTLITHESSCGLTEVLSQHHPARTKKNHKRHSTASVLAISYYNYGDYKSVMRLCSY